MESYNFYWINIVYQIKDLFVPNNFYKNISPIKFFPEHCQLLVKITQTLQYILNFNYLLLIIEKINSNLDNNSLDASSKRSSS